MAKLNSLFAQGEEVGDPRDYSVMMSYVLSFLTNIPCSMRSKAFLKTKRTTLTKAPLPSVTQVHQMHKQMKGSMSYSPIQMRS